MKTLLEIVNLSADFLEKQGVQQGRREAIDLISFGLGLRPLDLYVQYDRPMNEQELESCRSLLKRRIKGEPSQHIRGSVEFFGCTFKVCKDVLIPRQETEILVDRIAKILSREELNGKKLLDLCCGSGCVGISLKKRFPELTVILSDLSAEALAIAKENAETNDVKVAFLQGDLLAPLNGEQIDYLVCNPPYISEEEFAGLDREVREFEPKMALVAPEGGLAFYRRLAAELKQALRTPGKAWLEIGYRQGKAITEILESCFPKKIELQEDWAGHDRFFFLEFE